MNKMPVEQATTIWENAQKSDGYQAAINALAESWCCQPTYIRNVLSLRGEQPKGDFAGDYLEGILGMMPLILSDNVKFIDMVRVIPTPREYSSIHLLELAIKRSNGLPPKLQENGKPIHLLLQKCRFEEAWEMCRIFERTLKPIVGYSEYDTLHAHAGKHAMEFANKIFYECVHRHQAAYKTAQALAQAHIIENDLQFSIETFEEAVFAFFKSQEKKRSAATSINLFQSFLRNDENPQGPDFLHIVNLLTDSYREFLSLEWGEFIIDSPCFKREEKVV